jgi:hypothetical protein
MEIFPQKVDFSRTLCMAEHPTFTKQNYSNIVRVAQTWKNESLRLSRSTWATKSQRRSARVSIRLNPNTRSLQDLTEGLGRLRLDSPIQDVAEVL